MQLPLPDPETLFAELCGNAKPLCGPRRSKRPRNSCGWSSSIVAWTHPCVRWRGPVRRCMRPSRTKRWRSACARVVHGCKRCYGGCFRCPRWARCLRGDALWSLTPAGCKPQEPQAQPIASLARWTCCPCSVSRCWSALSTPAKRSSIAPWLRGRSPWQTEARPIGRACVRRSRRAQRASYDSIPSGWYWVTLRERLWRGAPP